MSPSICLIGCGSAFDSIASDPAAYQLPDGWMVRKAESVASLSGSATTLLDGLSIAETQIFVAVDHNALNYARLEIYGAARLRGFRMAKLIHARAWLAPDVLVGDNVWIGAGAVVNRKVQIDSDVMVSPGARLDPDVRIGMHSWIGAGASVGEATQLGGHCVIGADMRIRAGLKIGKHCVLDTLGSWSQDMVDGCFVAPQFDSPARMIGPGYSFMKSRA